MLRQTGLKSHRDRQTSCSVHKLAAQSYSSTDCESWHKLPRDFTERSQPLDMTGPNKTPSPVAAGSLDPVPKSFRSGHAPR